MRTRDFVLCVSMMNAYRRDFGDLPPDDSLGLTIASWLWQLWHCDKEPDDYADFLLSHRLPRSSSTGGI